MIVCSSTATSQRINWPVPSPHRKWHCTHARADGVFGVQAPSNGGGPLGIGTSSLAPSLQEEPDPMSPHRRVASPPACLEHRLTSLDGVVPEHPPPGQRDWVISLSAVERTNRHPLRMSCRGVGFELKEQLLIIAHSPSHTTPCVSGGSSMARCLVGMSMNLALVPPPTLVLCRSDDEGIRNSPLRRWLPTHRA